MNNSRTLSFYSRIVAVVSLLMLAFSIVKEYSSFTISDHATVVVSMSVSFLSIVLFACFCMVFNVDSRVRSAGFTLFLAFVLEFLGEALTLMPAAKSSFLIIALAAVVPVTGFILLIIGLFKIASRGYEYKRFAVSARCLAVVKIVYFAVLVGAGMSAAATTLGSGDIEEIKSASLMLDMVFGKIFPLVATSWFYWELGRWITVRWENHKEDYS